VRSRRFDSAANYIRNYVDHRVNRNYVDVFRGWSEEISAGSKASLTIQRATVHKLFSSGTAIRNGLGRPPEREETGGCGQVCGGSGKRGIFVVPGGQRKRRAGLIGHGAAKKTREKQEWGKRAESRSDGQGERKPGRLAVQFGGDGVWPKTIGLYPASTWVSGSAPKKHERCCTQGRSAESILCVGLMPENVVGCHSLTSSLKP